MSVLSLSVSLYLLISVYLGLSLLKSMLLSFQDMGSFCFSYKMIGYRKPNRTINMSSPCLSYSWVPGSNYKAPGHMEILWGHLKSSSLDTPHSSLSTCHLSKLFLKKETQASTALKSPKQTEFQLSSSCDPHRGRHGTFFLKDRHWVVTFCFPSFPPSPWSRDSLLLRILVGKYYREPLSCVIYFLPTLIHVICIKLFFPCKDLDFWNSKARGNSYCFSHSGFLCLPWSIYHRAPSTFLNGSRNL